LKKILKGSGRKSTQEFIGIKGFTKYGLATNKGELVFFLVSPTNISVLSHENIEIKVRRLLMALESMPDLEMACLDSCECFDENKRFVMGRLEAEDNPAVRSVLEKDLAFLDGIQVEMATARQFLFIKRLRDSREDAVFAQMNRVQKIISEQGFEARVLDKEGIKRLLALYFGASAGGGAIGDYDGEGYLAKHMKGRKVLTEEEKEALRVKGFFDLVLPGTIRFYPDTYVVGDYRCCAWAVKEYPTSTEEQAILARLADREGVTLHFYNRLVEPVEQRKIIQNAARKNRLKSSGTDVNDAVSAESNLQDVAQLIANMHRDKEPLLHTAVYIELRAQDEDKLADLKAEVLMELARAKVGVDRLTLRQKEGFLSVMPAGFPSFGAQYERVLPASSTANLYPFNYSGKTDPQGFYLGRDKYGTNILADFDKREGDKTNANILILGNSGQGKSYLLKLILTNLRECGKTVIALDAEAEYEELTRSMGGCYIDFMGGEYIINPLQPQAWSEDGSCAEDGSGDGAEEGGGSCAGTDDGMAPEAFRKVTRLSQHIAYLKDFFRAYKDFSDAHIDTIEIMLGHIYGVFGITDQADYSQMAPEKYPTVSDLYRLVEYSYRTFDGSKKHLYTEETLREILLGLHSMCSGAESKYFNGHTNIKDDRFLCFGIKGLMDTNKKLKDAMLFNILSYMSGALLGRGGCVAAIDELYLFLTNMTAIEYIRNAAKRVRKKDSAIILASQNVDDFLLEGIREYTKPLFSIPTHQFLFNAGHVEPRAYTDTLQVEQAEFDLIKYPERGVCLYRCGNERYLLKVIAPPYKAMMFGDAGGR